jgi:hypothetical protein
MTMSLCAIGSELARPCRGRLRHEGAAEREPGSPQSRERGRGVNQRAEKGTFDFVVRCRDLPGRAPPKDPPLPTSHASRVSQPRPAPGSELTDVCRGSHTEANITCQNKIIIIHLELTSSLATAGSSRERFDAAVGDIPDASSAAGSPGSTLCSRGGSTGKTSTFLQKMGTGKNKETQCRGVSLSHRVQTHIYLGVKWAQ